MRGAGRTEHGWWPLNPENLAAVMRTVWAEVEEEAVGAGNGQQPCSAGVSTRHPGCWS